MKRLLPLLILPLLLWVSCEKYEYISDGKRFNKKTGETEILTENDIWKSQKKIIEDRVGIYKGMVKLTNPPYGTHEREMHITYEGGNYFYSRGPKKTLYRLIKKEENIYYYIYKNTLWNKSHEKLGIPKEWDSEIIFVNNGIIDNKGRRFDKMKEDEEID